MIADLHFLRDLPEGDGPVLTEWEPFLKNPQNPQGMTLSGVRGRVQDKLGRSQRVRDDRDMCEPAVGQCLQQTQTDGIELRIRRSSPTSVTMAPRRGASVHCDKSGRDRLISTVQWHRPVCHHQRMPVEELSVLNRQLQSIDISSLLFGVPIVMLELDAVLKPVKYSVTRAGLV